MSKPRPNFCVGEEVLICDLGWPEYHGRKTQVIKLWWSNKIRCYATDTLCSSSYLYATPETESIDSEKKIGWGEEQLRKLPPEERTTWDDEIWSPVKDKQKA